MPTNIEIKARVADPLGLRELAGRLADSPVEILEQTDTFFVAPSGRLKLRQEGPESGFLIFYDRPDAPGPRASVYQIAPTSDPVSLRAMLSRVLGELGEVRKTRLLYRMGQTRVHLDEVQGLGWFVELEVVLGDDDSPELGREIALDLMRRLSIEPADLIDRAYFDLLRDSRS